MCVRAVKIEAYSCAAAGGLALNRTNRCRSLLIAAHRSGDGLAQRGAAAVFATTLPLPAQVPTAHARRADGLYSLLKHE